MTEFVHARRVTALVRCGGGTEFAAMRGEFVDVTGVRMYYYAAGTRGGGDPVVLIHGFPGSSHTWRHVAPLLPEGRRLIIVDQVGCGRSDGPGGTPISVSRLTALLVGLLDELRVERAAVVGHGTGGTVAQALAVSAPSRVSALALFSCPAFEERLRVARMARAVAPAARLLGPSLLASFVHGSAVRGYMDRDQGGRSLDMALRPYAAQMGLGAILAHLAALRDPEIAEYGLRLATIRVPTAVVWGANDPFISVSVGSRLRDTIPGATLDVIPGARHFIPEEAPEHCARVVSALLARVAT